MAKKKTKKKTVSTFRRFPRVFHAARSKRSAKPIIFYYIVRQMENTFVKTVIETGGKNRKTMVKISTRFFSDEKRSDEYLQRRRDDRREGRRERREGWWNFWNQLPPLLGGRDGPLIQRYPVIRSTRINCPSAFNYPIPDIQLTTFHYANHFSRRANFSTRFQFRARGKETKKQRKSV